LVKVAWLVGLDLDGDQKVLALTVVVKYLRFFQVSTTVKSLLKQLSTLT